MRLYIVYRTDPPGIFREWGTVLGAPPKFADASAGMFSCVLFGSLEMAEDAVARLRAGAPHPEFYQIKAVVI